MTDLSHSSLRDFIRVLLIEDHGTYCEALAKSLEPEFEIVAKAASDAAAQAARSAAANVAVLCATTPGLREADLVRRLLAAAPGLKVLVLSTQEETGAVYKTLQAGAAGYLTTETSLAELRVAIRKVAGGGRVISPRLVDVMLFDGGGKSSMHSSLSERELQVVCEFARGQSVKQIAGAMNLSAKTVSTHKTRLMQKLHLKNNADLVRYALESELI